MAPRKNSSLPKEVQQAAQQIADDITHATICNLYGSPELAQQEFRKNPPTTPSMRRMAEWTEKHLAASDSASEKETASMAMPSGKNVPSTEGPLDKLTFPGKAPAPSFTMPGDKTGTPGTATPTQKLNDETIQPDGSRPETYSPPGDKTGTPGTETPTQKESEDSQFPKQTHAGSRDMSTEVPPGPQGPETERHNPDLHQKRNEQQKSNVIVPPWELAFTQGLDFLKKAEGVPAAEAPKPEEDGHFARIEKCAREADLYSRRFAKRNDFRDLRAQAAAFKSERDGMDEMKDCTKCEDESKTKAKETFAFSYGQMRRSIRQAMRQFTEQEEVKDVEAYHEIHALRADLLGEKSQRHFAAARISAQYANFAAFDDEEDPHDEGTENCDEFSDEFSKQAGPPAPPNPKEDDMKEEDVKAGFDLATKLHMAGLIDLPKMSAMALKLAKMDPQARASFIEMSGELVGEGKPEEKDEKCPPAACKSASAAIAEGNLVHTASRATAGGSPKRTQTAGLMGMFMGGQQAPLLG